MGGPRDGGHADVHYRWSRRHPPITEVVPGDLLSLTTRDRFDEQLSGSLTGEDLDQHLYAVLDIERFAPLTGPFAVRGARPGDVLRVGIERLEPVGVGVAVVWPSWPEWDFIAKGQRGDFSRAHLRRVSLDGCSAGDRAELVPGARVRIAPSLGILGVAPASGEFDPWSAWQFGGAIDVKEVRSGSAVYLPVGCDGALVSLGGGRAAQADGAVATTALECPLRVTLKIDLVKDWPLTQPRIETLTEMMTPAFARTLDAAAQDALRLMLDALIDERGLSPEDAYMLCSLAGDLRINQVSGRPHVGARMAIPRRYLSGTRHALASE